jgi:hypothetical protein
VFKAVAKLLHLAIEFFFAYVAERGMAQVMHQRQGFGVFLIQPKRDGNGARHLGDFQRVGEAVAEMVAKAGGEDLGFAFHAAEGAGMDDAVAVALKIVAVGMRRFRIETAAEMVWPEAQMAQHVAGTYFN